MFQDSLQPFNHFGISFCSRSVYPEIAVEKQQQQQPFAAPLVTTTTTTSTSTLSFERATRDASRGNVSDETHSEISARESKTRRGSANVRARFASLNAPLVSSATDCLTPLSVRFYLYIFFSLYTSNKVTYLHYRYVLGKRFSFHRSFYLAIIPICYFSTFHSGYTCKEFLVAIEFIGFEKIVFFFFYFFITYVVRKKRKYCNRKIEKKILSF